ncbi:hypothetical protein TTHERM_00412010 (macronuclear) [Tetrahymena thermophila SB210]|uniref:Uncharacterized protein n=1 Tax=Tetrahymena thermophila (strain SB210) TaxID=312017 RepID=I7MFW1_TETTS|nr:hypothetical protein TTHERM_00412010 [Tetrahymena thermophila SB210]EAS00650.2 hypothetical protein TTHERM_00412010 [Tetrahymena thermophila SB210]|eukprot:XP_001020895.2 hypothetical protein TTHERM_00412010 [Tetrahymena thermophila SB210]
MDQQNLNNLEFPEEILEFVNKIIEQNKLNEKTTEVDGNYDPQYDQDEDSLTINDPNFLKKLQEYDEKYEEQNQEDNKIDIEIEQVREEAGQINSVNQSYKQELTYEEKLKWIDDVFNADYFKHEDHNQDRIQDEQSQDSNDEDDIYQMEKQFFEKIKQQQREEEEKRQAQAEKNRKLYEEIVGEKHRKVQIIVLSSTSSSQQSSPKNNSRLDNDKEENNTEYQEGSNMTGIEQNNNKIDQNAAFDQFCVKEEYFSDEERESLQNEKIDTIMDQENKEIENKEKDYIDEIQNLYQQDKNEFMNAYSKDANSDQYSNQRQENLEAFSYQDSNNINDYEKELEDLFDRLNIK